MRLIREICRSFSVWLLFCVAASSAFAQPSAPTDNNVHVDRGVLASNVVLFSATGGTPPYTFTFDAAALPTGLAVSSSGVLNGVTCRANGKYNFGPVTVTDTLGATASATGLSIIVNASPSNACSLTLSANPVTGTVAAAYTGSVTASGGSGPYTYTLASGSLPPGLSLSGAGLITGTPTSTGSYTFTVRGVDSAGASGVGTLTITVNPAVTVTITPASLPAGPVGVAYSQTLSASGGTGPYTFVAGSGSLPAGLSLSRGGVLSGTPTVAGSTNVTVLATDANGAQGNRSYTISISAAPGALVISPAVVPGGSVAAPYSQALAASGGTAGYTFVLLSGSLPPGLSLSAAGGLTGTPTTVGSSSFVVQATDSLGVTGSQGYALDVAASLVAVQRMESLSLPLGQPGTPFIPVVGQGGVGPYQYSVAGALPAGLVMDPASGQISGTPSAASAATVYTVTVLDSTGASASRSFTLATASVVIDLQPRTLIVPAAGLPYSGTLVAGGGVGPYTLSIVAGALPQGLVMDASGNVSGRTPVGGTSNITVHVTDANGAANDIVVNVQVGARPDPTADPVVTGLQLASTEALKRFGNAQIDNVLNRLDADLECLPTLDSQLRVQADWRNPNPGAASGAQPAGGASAPAAETPAPHCREPYAVWIGGTLDHGRLGNVGAAQASRFSSSGLSIGVDTALASNVRAGVALGRGQDRVNVGDGKGRLDSSGNSLTLYATWRTAVGLRLDAAIGQSNASMDLSRTVTGDTEVVRGARDARLRYVVLAATGRLETDGWRVAPQVSVRSLRARLDAYAESGTSPLALDYGSASLASTELRGSITLSRPIWSSGWMLEPRLRIEARRQTQGTVAQELRYADGLDNNLYTLSTATPQAEQANLSLGLRLSDGSGWDALLAARTTLGGSTLRSQGFDATLQRRF